MASNSWVYVKVSHAINDGRRNKRCKGDDTSKGNVDLIIGEQRNGLVVSKQLGLLPPPRQRTSSNCSGERRHPAVNAELCASLSTCRCRVTQDKYSRLCRIACLHALVAVRTCTGLCKRPLV